MSKNYQMYIGGKWVDAVDGKTFEDMNPYTGEVYAHLPAGKREDARRAIEAAQVAFPEWAKTPPSVRRKIFLKAADILESRQDELVKAMMEEVTGGKYDNLVYDPTIVTDVKPTMRIFSDQTFGPVVPIVVVNDEPQCRSVASKAVVTGALVGKLHLMNSRSCAGSASNRPSEHFHK